MANIWEVVLPLCSDAVGVFCSPSLLGHRTLVVGEVLSLCRDAVSVFCSPSLLGHSTRLVGEVVSLCRDAVSVFCSPSWLGFNTEVNKTLIEIEYYEMHTISFQSFFVWALLLIVHTWKLSPLRSNLLWLQCTCSTVPTTYRRPHESALCERGNNLRHSLFHLLNCLITTASELRE